MPALRTASAQQPPNWRVILRSSLEWHSATLKAASRCLRCSGCSTLSAMHRSTPAWRNCWLRVRAAGQPTAIAAPATQPVAPATALPTDPAELFAKLQAAYKADDWPAVVQLATALHASAPEYESGTVGAQLFVGLRNRGTEAIENRSLGPGIMWLERAQELAPLDSGASALLQWAKIYTLANSWWGINWPYAIGQYSDLYRAAPNFMDTRVRLRQAYAEYGAQLLSSDACAAQLQFAAALELEAMPELEAQRLAAEQACALLAAAATPLVEETPAATPTPTP